MSFYNGFNDKEDVERQFHTKLADDIQILYAHYNQDNYEGEAIVIYSQNDKLFEVHGSHCSCHGLEDQFNPESCTYEDIVARLEIGKFPYVDTEKLKSIIENWSAISHFGLDFNFDNLPDAKEIINKLSIKKILENKEYFLNKDTAFKEIKKHISESIKQGILNLFEEVEVKYSLEINPLLQKNLPLEKLNKLILGEFKDIQNILVQKNWNTNMSIQDNNIVLDIKLPTLKNITKQHTRKKNH